MTYQVYLTKSFDEPWWMEQPIPQADIIEKRQYDQFEEAFAAFHDIIDKQRKHYERVKTRQQVMTALWTPGEVAYCVPCENDEQLYLGVFIYEAEKPLSDTRLEELTENVRKKES